MSPLRIAQRLRRRTLLAFGAAALAAAVPILGVAPAAASQGNNVGAGWMAGTLNFGPAINPLVEYVPGQLDPVVVNPCGAAAWNYADSGASGGAVVNSALVWYQGLFQTFTISGGGNPECPASILGGAFNVGQITGSFPTGNHLSCSNLTGTYNRVGTIVVAQATGSCVTNFWANGSMGINVVGLVTPTTIGAGVISPVDTALFTGGWVAVTP